MLKPTGVIRKVDEVGRIFLPIDLIWLMGIRDNKSVEICAEDDRIIMKNTIPCVTFAPEPTGSRI